MIWAVLVRVGLIVPVLLGVSLAVFLMLHVLPVDPVQVMLTQNASGQAPSAQTTEAQMVSLRHELGLDRSLPVQFLTFVGGAVTGDLGQSYRSRQDVGEMLLSQYPYTARLALSGLVFAVVVGILLGSLSGMAPGSWIDRGSMLIASIGVAAPTFWIGLMLIFLFAIVLNLLPVLGTGSVQAMILPAITLGLPGAAIIARLTRTNLIAIFREQFITTAQAKGLTRLRVFAKHAMPNVMLPVLTVIGLQFGNLMTGTVVVETVFSRPGIGRMGVGAILQSDYPVVQGFALVVASTYVVVNMIVDLACAWLDPRLRSNER